MNFINTISRPLLVYPLLILLLLVAEGAASPASNPPCNICSANGGTVPSCKSEQLVDTGSGGERPTCGDLYEKAANGFFPPIQCAELQNSVADFCCTDDDCVVVDDGSDVPSEVPATAPPDSTPEPTPSVIFFEDFERGLGTFFSAGDDAAISADFAYGGSDTSLRIRDNTATSQATTAVAYDVSAYSELIIDFFYLAKGMNTCHSFVLEFNDGNGRWEVARRWIRGTDFVNNEPWNEGNVLLRFENGFWTTPGAAFPLSTSKTSFQFRFRCEGDVNNDRVFIDDVVFQGNY